MSSITSATDFLKTTGHTAEHFGFQRIEKLKKNPDCKSCTERIEHKASAADRKTDALHGMLTAGICNYFDSKLNGIEGPLLFYSTDNVPRSGETAISLHIVNVEKSIAEAILIQTVRGMLEEVGHEHNTVRINSLGDQESSLRYIRELTNFLRKRIDDIPAPARELMKEHVLTALMHLIEKEHELADKSPSPLEYLSDSSRKHFREIIEYLDLSNTPYEIDTKLLGHHHCYSDAIFAFDLLDDDGTLLEDQPLYVRGGRYNTFVSRFSKTETPAAGAVVVLRNKKGPMHAPRFKKSVPSVFVVQLGFGPKVKSLLLIDELRQAKIPVHQDIVSDSLSAQLRKAEDENVRYAVILGQKEFVEGTVILRDLHAQSQENIPSNTLVSYLKRTVG